MKKLLLFLLLISSFANAQEELGLNKYAQKWAVACSVYPLPRTFAAINLFINSENNNGNWAKLDGAGVLGVGVSTSALVEIVNDRSATAVNSPTFTSYQGYAGNGTNSYINTGYNPATNGVNFTQNSACYGVWVRTASQQNKVDMGIVAASNFSCYLQANFNGTSGQTNINSGTSGSTFINFGKASSENLLSSARTASNAVAIYVNGVSSAAGTTTSNALVSSNFTICQGASLFSTDQISFWFTGSSSLNQSTFYTDVTNLAKLLQW